MTYTANLVRMFWRDGRSPPRGADRLPGAPSSPRDSGRARSPLTKSYVLASVSSLIAALTWVVSSEAAPAGPSAGPSVSQPQMDLGDTSFLDGEAGQGALLEIIGEGTAAAYLTDGSGRALEGRNKEWSSTVIIHPAYVSGVAVLGGHLGGELLVPFAAVHLNLNQGPSTTEGGVGDITFAPFIQWSNLQLLGRPLSARLAMQFVAPTGTYSRTRDINMGQNAWQVSPYLAYTWRPTNRWELSGRAIYDWSGRNDRPALASAARGSEAGDQFAMDFAASFAVSQTWRVGLSGYVLRQLSDARLDDEAIVGLRQQAVGLGPGLRWKHGDTSVIATVYREFETRNRPEGFNAVLRLLQPF
jgi:hypothetical protein